MENTALLIAKNDTAIGVRDLKGGASEWLLDCEIRQLSLTTIQNRRLLVDKLLWFLDERECRECGVSEVREFLAYLATGHKAAQGRWGNPYLRKGVKPRTLATYYTNLRTLFRYLVSDGVMTQSPVEGIRPPIARADQVMPYSEQELAGLIESAKRTAHPRRDEAIVLFLLDTGVRASELCGLGMADLDLPGRRAVVLGKGSKRRVIFFGKWAAKALRRYLAERPAAEGPVFLADRGLAAKEGLTRSGLLQLIRRLGRKAGVRGADVHRFRHSFAVSFLRSGANVFTLKELLGHTSLTICNRYVALAQADLEAQHRAHSPVDGLRKPAGRARLR